MKKILITSLVLILSFYVQAQLLKPAKWRTDVSAKEVKANQTLDLIFYADIEEKWYLYSSDFDPDLGPTVTTFAFTPDKSYELVGKIKPVGSKKKYDNIFDGEYTYFTKKAEFRQTVKILQSNPVIKVKADFQVCSEENGKCVPGKENFTFSDIKLLASNDAIPEKNPEITQNPVAQTTETDTAKTLITQPEKTQTADKQTINKIENAAVMPETSLGQFILSSIGWGLLALVMPCIFPLIPMTVTYFVKQSKNQSDTIKKVAFYGFSIVAIYTLLGVVFSFFFKTLPQNAISTHWLPNLLIFLVLVIFALSFLGLFEITAPSDWSNAADQQADKGGYYGIFFMALTLVLVSFSCTVPLVGNNLVAAAGGEFFRPAVGMFFFSLAMALPFMIFAAFPTLLQKLPKSGSWMQTIKVVLGFFELAFALKFLSQIDVVYRWNFLDKGLFLAFWIVIFALMGFYLLGKIQLPHDTKTEKIPVPRLMLAIVVLAFVVYMVPGLFGAPLRPLAAYLPPYQEFDLFERTNFAGNKALFAKNDSNFPKVKYQDKFELPHGLQGFFDYNEALAYAKQVNKPILIDFTGHGCGNCRVMEKNVWVEPEVLKRLQDDYILLALYVDDRTQLSENEWITSTFDKEVKKTIGEINADFQVTRFQNNAQPFYCLLNHEGELLMQPKAYDLKTENFVNFLDEGLKNFKSGKTANSPTALK
ncbi:MAG: thioredoxin family protein [Verrucomicrobia bacterium]|nr:thioredoxin family protein [Cytophagales bacterium]